MAAGHSGFGVNVGWTPQGRGLPRLHG